MSRASRKPSLSLRVTLEDLDRLDRLIHQENARRAARPDPIRPEPVTRHAIGLTAMRLGMTQLEGYEAVLAASPPGPPRPGSAPSSGDPPA